MKRNILIFSLVAFIITVVTFCIVSSLSYGERTDTSVIEKTKDTEVPWICHDFMTNTVDEYMLHDEEDWLCTNFLIKENIHSIETNSYISPVINEKSIIEENKVKTKTVILSKKQLTDKSYDISYMRSCLIHLLFFEACGGKTEEDIKEQRAIISVVINRFNSNKYKGCYDVEDIIFFKYPDTVKKDGTVVKGAYAFSPASNKDRFWFRGEWKDSNTHKDFLNNYEQLAEKVDYVLSNGVTVPSEVMYFVSNNCYKTSSHFNNKDNYTVYAVYDDTTFMTDNK